LKKLNLKKFKDEATRKVKGILIKVIAFQEVLVAAE
jgi:hypothetical protein